ncbi:tax1-binding protein 3 homolog [Lineus longissimus]|uniref:tax1-binding protein 3 homolog n=1 Tax=Lineus longissimus TaxID=88925 RepID=UPI00315DC029
MAHHTAGQPLECYSIPLILHKEAEKDENGAMVYEPDGKGGKQVKYRCGFRIGGGIDQDYTKSPHGYKDTGIYVTFVYDSGPASQAGLLVHDKILQVNGHDFTMVTHKKAVDYIKKKPTLNMLVYRKGVPQMQKSPTGQQPMQQMQQPQQQQGQYQSYQQQQQQYSPPYQRQY